MKMLKLFNYFLAASLSATLAIAGLSKVAPDLQAKLQAGKQVNIIISFVGGTKASLRQFNSLQFNSRIDKLNALYDNLLANAERSQAPVLKLIKSEINASPQDLKSFWVSNQVFLRNADLSLVQAIAEDTQVSSIDEEVVAHLIEAVEKREVPSRKETEVEWGIERIQAPEAWVELAREGLDAGEGVVVATIDGGVRGTHEALRDNFVGKYGWLDPPFNTTIPTDRNGHGTHTMGTIAGSKGIGVAPGAKWASCRGCASNSCYQSDLLACGGFIACPSLTDGSSPDCSKAPNVVSNSWGGRRGETWYNPVIEAWHAAGIIPLSSIGNSQPRCGSAGSPGDQDLIGVGSTTITDSISEFSSFGPSAAGIMKPEIVAPGSDVISAYHTSDTAYISMSGTSMSCPHAAGTLALILTRKTSLRYEDAKSLLLNNTDQDLQFSGLVCGGIRDDVFPNHIFGHGRINAFKSIRAQSDAN